MKISSIVASLIPLLTNQAEANLNYEITNPNDNVRTKDKQL